LASAATLGGSGQENLMTEQASAGPSEACRYEIRLGTLLAPRWTTWFDGMTLTRAPDGTTVLTGPVADQAALHGLLAKVRDLGVPLMSVTQLEPGAGHTR
jgi:hypothetical protein